MNDNDIYNLISDKDNYMDINNYLKNNEHSIFYDAYKHYLNNNENNINKCLSDLENYILNNFEFCTYCGDIEHINDLYYQEGSSSGYYNTIYDYDLELENDIPLTSELSSYIYDNIPSDFDNSYYCSFCIDELLNEINILIIDYIEQYGGYVNEYHTSNFENKSNSILTLGFEIEHQYTVIPSFNSIKKFISNYGGFLHPERDGSLGMEGIEWITDILDFEWLFKNKDFVKEFFNTVENLLNITSDCGGHLHTNIKFCGDTTEQQKNTIKTLIEFCNNNDQLIKAISGRNSHSFGYCEIPQSYREYENSIITDKYSAINVHNQTIEFRFWNVYKSYDSMIRRAVISYYMLYLAKTNTLTIENLYNVISLYNMTSEINFNWYLEKISIFL